MFQELKNVEQLNLIVNMVQPNVYNVNLNLNSLTMAALIQVAKYKIITPVLNANLVII